MNYSNKSRLNLADFIVLSVLFFGYFSAVSIWGYFYAPVLDPISASSFSDEANWFTVTIELCALIVAFIYLYLRRFDFSLIPISVGKSTLPWALGLVLLGALLSDTLLYGSYWLISGENPFLGVAKVESFFSHISIGLLVFAFVNGFYEELFFMGLAFAVKPEHTQKALVLSVFVRFIFHIYQGLPSAFAIALTGVAFILLRKKVGSIVPFILAHAVFDLFGAGIIGLLLSL
ncbi:CPBP family intramembrane glutamic endopeptidase [Actinobacillus lignieresii]|uniref:CAAX amino terminal protease self- immunity n=1 Tax=Actinobacillus lignieresii TaxID=720 RepID=A0A380TVV5_ACTLI|nr:CPBP family intramembrane glutamic endopeptidase [Actinobacillus lignieresii]SUT91975.1 CAAX amino terminal protease self- immunity [Actinobacillus lignieresii]